jgi:hypothetical protein
LTTLTQWQECIEKVIFYASRNDIRIEPDVPSGKFLADHVELDPTVLVEPERSLGRLSGASASRVEPEHRSGDTDRVEARNEIPI